MVTEPRERGSVTAELAVGSVVAVVAIMLVLGVAVVGSARVRAQLAAGSGARAVARGESSTAVVEQVRLLAGLGATATVTTTAQPGGGADAGTVRVLVERPITLALPGSPTFIVRASAAALREDRPEDTGANPDGPGGVDTSSGDGWGSGSPGAGEVG